MTKINLKILLKDKIQHDVMTGDVFDFDFKMLKDTSFEDSRIGDLIFSHEPKIEKVIVKIVQGKITSESTYTIDMFDGEGQIVDNLKLDDPMFFSYIACKQNMTFIKNEELEYVPPKYDLKFNDLYIVPFEKCIQNTVFKKEVLEKLTNKNAKYIATHLFNVSEGREHIYNAFGLVMYAFNDEKFVNLLTDKENEEIKKEENPDPDDMNTIGICDLMSHLTSGEIEFYTDKGLLSKENKVGNIAKRHLSLNDLTQFTKKNLCKKTMRL